MLEKDEITSNHIVIPAKAGTHLRTLQEMGFRFRGDDVGSLTLILH